jgi:electron transfer flavoprotein alpha subunit
MALGECDTTRTGEIIMEDAGLSEADMNVEILKVAKNEKKAVDITDAKILVSGGRGVGGSAGYEPLRELAAELGGEVSSSRIGVDSGWIERERQVGQTGKTVHPQLYIACGISGAIQHQAGMEDSEFILAINTDVHCPMMQLADLGIVGDLKKIVPALTEAVKKYKASQAV